MTNIDYAELQVTTCYSFGRGASHPEELFARAAALGVPALGIADRNSVAGIVRAWAAARATGVRLVAGARLELSDGAVLLTYPTDKAAWSRLCRLLTLGKGRAGKGGFVLGWDDLVPKGAGGGEGLLFALVANRLDDAVRGWVARLAAVAPGRGYIAGSWRWRDGDAVRLQLLQELGDAAGVPLIVTGDVLFHEPERRRLHDVMTCIRAGCTIDEAGYRLEPGGDRHLLPPDQVAVLFARHPAAMARTMALVARCRFDPGELRYQYPAESDDPAESAQQALERLSWAGAAVRYPGGVPEVVAAQLRHELRLIGQLDYAPYFLTVNSIVGYARGEGILCQGRGSAANSAVCWVLGITAIDPTATGLLFERFVSAERREPPDIDVDFEHERREQVIQWVYEHYGRDRAALCATVVRYRARGALRAVGKVMGLPEDVTGALSGQVWGWSEEGVTVEHAAALNLNLDDPRLRLSLELARELIGFPRYLGQHPGGFVLTRAPLPDLVPVAPAAMRDRQIIEWDKDDIDLLRFMKVDVLGLGMLGCMRRGFDLLLEHRGVAMGLAEVPQGDAATFAMIRRADTLGTFQIESRAQMSMLPRMKPATLYDLTIQVAIVRPGPIQGDMVHPYLRRREGKETVDYVKPELRRVLEKTLGVPLFQEQAMQVAIQCAGFTPGEADGLRRAMATFKVTEGVSHFKAKLIEGMVAKGFPRDFAERTFGQIEGFGSYGFPESHAASFALIAYASSWLKCHHPDVFCAALLNSQPMGFYAPAQIVRDAREHGVAVRPVDVNHSRWDCTLEAVDGRYLAVRLGMRMVKGLGAGYAAAVIAARGEHPYAGIEEMWRRAAGVPVAALERLAEADGYGSMGLDRRGALWAIRALSDAPLPLFAAADAGGMPRPEIVEPAVELAAMRPGRVVVEDYGSVGLTLRQHPAWFMRDELRARGMVTCAALAEGRDGRRVCVPGLVLVRQKPGSAKGVMFITIEDETGVANLILWPSVFERQRRLVLGASMIACHGRVQREGGVIHVIAERLEDLTPLLRAVGEREEMAPLPTGRGDGARHGGSPDAREGGVIHVIAERLEDLTPLLSAVGEREEMAPLPTGRGDGTRHGGSPDARDGGRVRDIASPERGGGIRVETRDFR